MRSSYEILGWPTEITAILFVLALILCLTPYLSGTDLGVFRIPNVPSRYRRFLQWIGPAVMVCVLLGFAPFFAPEQVPARLPVAADRLRNQLKEIQNSIAVKQDQLRRLAGIEKELADVRDLEGDYRKVFESILPTSAAEHVKTESEAILSRLKEYDLTNDDLRIVATAEEAASGLSGIAYPESVYPHVRRLAESLDKRRETLENDLAHLRSKESDLLRRLQDAGPD